MVRVTNSRYITVLVNVGNVCSREKHRRKFVRAIARSAAMHTTRQPFVLALLKEIAHSIERSPLV
jgi:hypothetical protein